MRTREQITKDLHQYDQLTLEVLLDIRDLLSSEKVEAKHQTITTVPIPAVEKKWANMNAKERKEFQNKKVK